MISSESVLRKIKTMEEQCFMRFVEAGALWVPARRHHKDALMSLLYTPMNYILVSPIYVCVEHEDGGNFEVSFVNRPTKYGSRYFDETGREVSLMICHPNYAEFHNRR